MADPAFPGFLPGGPDSADPKAILRDLQQLSLVAQKLGIDLQKTAAMGQTVAGQKGNGPTSIRETHQANMPGGGTGYQNMAAGQIAGSVIAGSLPKMVKEYKDWKEKGFPDGFGGQSAKEAARHRMKHGSSVAGRKWTDGYGEEHVVAGTSSMKIRKPGRHDFGKAANRRFNEQFTTIYGLMSLYGALTDPVNEQAGETRLTKIGDAAIGTGRAMALGEAMSAGLVAKEAFSAARAAGKGKVAAAAAAGRAALPGAGMAAAGLMIAYELDNVMDLKKEYNKTKWELGALSEGFNPSIRPARKPAVWKPQASDSVSSQFNEIAKRSSENYYIDPNTGERKERGFLGKLYKGIGRLPFGIRPLWSGKDEAEALAREKEYRIKEAQKAHASATKKIEIMDWQGAIEDTQKAKKQIVVEELMPFFWKQPEKFLRAMESSRVAGRNWARSQQPRGASRSGD